MLNDRSRPGLAAVGPSPRSSFGAEAHTRGMPTEGRLRSPHTRMIEIRRSLLARIHAQLTGATNELGAKGTSGSPTHREPENGVAA